VSYPEGGIQRAISRLVVKEVKKKADRQMATRLELISRSPLPRSVRQIKMLYNPICPR
jgi:hypothetical protein